MILTSLVSILTLYFAFSLGVAGLAKIDRPLGRDGIGLRMRLVRLFFSPMASRVLGAFEIVLAFLLALGIRIELVATVNAALFGLFLLFKLFLKFKGKGTSCGCFGAYELTTIDLTSVIASALILGLAVILAVLVQRSLPGASSAIIFLMAFGWLVFKTLCRRRLENKLIQRMSTGAVQDTRV